MKAILVSKRFNPGHVSHMVANSKLLEEHGFDVRFSLHERFLPFSGSIFKGREATAKDYLKLVAGDLFIVWFPSLSVSFHMLLVRLLSSATIVYVYHEPFTSFASYREAGFSRMKTLKITAISMVNRLLCSLSHKIILPSARAYEALPVAQSDTIRYAKINLLFSDEAQPDQIKKPRSFIAYIGTIAEDHAFDEFVHLMQACVAKQALLPLRFLIATRSFVPDKYRAVIDQCVTSGRLVLQAGRPMNNAEINYFYASSFVVWNAYKRSMQSGVLPKAYMFGTPVLVSTSNQSEYFQEGVHGALLSARYTLHEFQRAITWLHAEWPAISGNCRAQYLQNFDYHALSSTFMNFVSDNT